jgi:hypothetical protein
MTRASFFIGLWRPEIATIDQIHGAKRDGLMDLKQDQRPPRIPKCRSGARAMTNLLLNAEEAAQILRMDRRTLIVWARLGYVPAHPLGEGKRKSWRFLERELLDWVEAQESNKKRLPTSTIEVAIGARARRTA